MGFRLSLPTVIILSVLRVLFFAYEINGVSIWEPFCKEEKIYTPYVRVFHKGRNGAMLRDRGPGFIDLSGLSDIYVCTNGLVMMYYSKTTAMGEVYEHGELHWSPHHCELYNPSPNSGMKSDFPKKCLLSILLIGHPQDFRLPALQMFVAPLYDRKYGGYVNATSLIMIGNDGECLIEKGSERARLRVRLATSKIVDEIDKNNTDTVKDTNIVATEFMTYPPMFCQLDVQRKLGQSQNVFVTLSVTDKDNPKFVYVPPYGDKGSWFTGEAEELLSKVAGNKKETGPAIYPRFKLSEADTTKGFTDKTPLLVVDEVYAALLSDRKMHFVGCLRYPDFGDEQQAIIKQKAEAWKDTSFKVEDDLKDITPAATAPFWDNETVPPWESDKTKIEKRFTSYITKITENDAVEKYDTEKATFQTNLKQKEQDLEKALLAAQDQASPGTPEEKATAIKKEELEIVKLKTTFSLLPFKAAFNQIYLYLTNLVAKITKIWEELKTDLIVDTVPPIPDKVSLAVIEELKANALAGHRKEIANNMSQTRFNRRYEPYNPKLVEEYEGLSRNYTHYTTMLKLRSQKYGPRISDAETLTSRYKVYKGLLMKAHEDLINAVRHIERTSTPAIYVGGDPFEKTFVDTIIEISDSLKYETTGATDYYTEADPEYNSAKACHMLPKANDVCKDIKPDTKRADMILKNRQGKGWNWDTNDLWRQRVLDLIEDIFRKVCPYINGDFPTAISRIVKGYLIGRPPGTGLFNPINGSMLEVHDHKYQELVYKSTYLKIAPFNETPPETVNWKDPTPKLNEKTAFWDHILEALEHCDDNAIPMQFWHNEEGEKPAYITYRKFFPNNSTELHYDVEELIMQEKADQEYAFNWAIEMNWRIFATVLGVCMPRYENKIPLISSRFYALYSQDFLLPLRQIWMSNRDNPILKTILGNFYGACKGDRWARSCMEAAFVESGDRSYRPPRYLYVNAFTEMNYFTTGPLAGSSGMLGTVGSGNF